MDMAILKGEPLNHLGAGRLQFRSGSRCNGSLVGQRFLFYELLVEKLALILVRNHSVEIHGLYFYISKFI